MLVLNNRNRKETRVKFNKTPAELKVRYLKKIQLCHFLWLRTKPEVRSFILSKQNTFPSARGGDR